MPRSKVIAIAFVTCGILGAAVVLVWILGGSIAQNHGGQANPTGTTSNTTSQKQPSTPPATGLWGVYKDPVSGYQVQYDLTWRVSELYSGTAFTIGPNAAFKIDPFDSFGLNYYTQLAVSANVALKPFTNAYLKTIPDLIALHSPDTVLIERRGTLYTIYIEHAGSEPFFARDRPSLSLEVLFRRFVDGFRFIEPWPPADSSGTAP